MLTVPACVPAFLVRSSRFGTAKFFPYVTKIDNGYGDRNLCCRNCE
jgi:hypothetical protein